MDIHFLLYLQIILTINYRLLAQLFCWLRICKTSLKGA